ncbi:hypothetical protein FRB95_006613 [Tulasnella sp. JGI-2019a]|nr:hypothetical protein FRB93_005196 [Tulasnella sp. JGI-2019a]KAG9028309.1 hypothetical protein FRB95_006613 [Tulasnella sp. JGI-2019a]
MSTASAAASGRKRQSMGMDTGNIMEGSRKRRKDSPEGEQSGIKSASPPPPVVQAKKVTLKLKPKPVAATKSEIDSQDTGIQARTREMGLKMWNTVKNAKDSKGRLMATDFLKLPSKKLYPDYYMIIKSPTSLEEIKTRLENGTYTSVRAVKADFDTMFTNAKLYNMPESGIWLDAETLHTLVSHEYTALTGEVAPKPPIPESSISDAEDGPEAGSSKVSGKPRPPTLHNVLKPRLKKLQNVKDKSGRLLCGAFMTMPSKKDYPTYTKIIKKPMTFDIIEKKLQRKEYDSAQGFANDVELIFSNAYTFNEENSYVWTDAKVLQESFRTLMSDLPAPFIYTSPSESSAPTKIKLKVSQTTGAGPSGSGTAVASSTATAKPAKGVVKPETGISQAKTVASPAPTPAPSAPSVPPVSTKPTNNGQPAQAQQQQAQASAASYASNAQTQAQAQQLLAQYQAAGYTYYNMPAHVQAQVQLAYSSQQQQAQMQVSAQQQVAGGGSTLATPPAAVVSPQIPASLKPVAAKPASLKYIKGLTLRATPSGRTMRFEEMEDLGLQMWSMRLGGGERGVEMFDLEVYEKPIGPLSAEKEASSVEMDSGEKKKKKRGRPKTKGKAKGRGKKRADDDDGDEEMDIEEEDEEMVEHEDSTEATTSKDLAEEKSKDGKDVEEESTPIDVRVNALVIQAIPDPVQQPARSPTPPKPNDVIVNGNGHSGDNFSSSDLSELEDEPDGDVQEQSEDKKGKSRAIVPKTATPTPQEAGDRSDGPDTTPNPPATRVEKKRWESQLSLGSNILDVKVGADQAETWRIFVERVL